MKSGAGPSVSISCLLQNTFHIYWFYLPKQSTRKKQIVLLWPKYTVPRAIRVDLESSHKKGCDMISIMKQGRNTQKKVCHTARTHIWIRALREVDLEPSAKRGTNRTRALVNLYRSSWSLHLKQSPNQISHKPISRPYQIVSNLKKILCSSAYQNNVFQNNQGN